MSDERIKMYVNIANDKDGKVTREIFKYLPSMLAVEAKVDMENNSAVFTFDKDRMFKTGRKRKLSPDQEQKIYEESKTTSNYQLARKYGISPSGIRMIRLRYEKNDHSAKL